MIDKLNGYNGQTPAVQHLKKCSSKDPVKMSAATVSSQLTEIPEKAAMNGHFLLCAFKLAVAKSWLENAFIL